MAFDNQNYFVITTLGTIENHLTAPFTRKTTIKKQKHQNTMSFMHF